MAKVKFDVKKYFRQMKRKFNKFARDPKELERAASVIQRQIRADTRDGKGYTGKKFPSIKVSTVKRRRALAEVNRPSRFYKAFFSNATLTGDTVNKIKAKAKAKGRIELFGAGNHKALKGVRGKRLKGSNAPISKILGGLTDRGWKILGISKKAKSRILVQFKRWIRRNL